MRNTFFHHSFPRLLPYWVLEELPENILGGKEEIWSSVVVSCSLRICLGLGWLRVLFSFSFVFSFVFGKYLGTSQLSADPEIVQTHCFSWILAPNADSATSPWSFHLLHQFGVWQVKESLGATLKCGTDVYLRVFRKAVNAECCIFFYDSIILHWKTVTKRK